MTQSKSEQELDTPPYFKSWKSIYMIVTGFLVLMIILLQLFSFLFA